MIQVHPHISISLVKESDVGLLTETVRQICIDSRFDKVDTEEMVLACSEIGHNAVRHGLGGTAKLEILKSGKMVRVTISDNGPGIPNIEIASREGYSTVKTSLGLGLEGAQRLVDHFKISSKPGEGTKVILDKYRPLSRTMVDYGLVSIPDNNYNYNGDQYILKEYDGDSILIGVIDGPGQGYDAHSIAQTCKQFVEQNYREPLTELLAALNSLMKESNDETGITCSLARLIPGEITYAGLGDTHSYIQIDDHHLESLDHQEGRIGYVHRVKRTKTILTFEEKVTIIMCSDGIRSFKDIDIKCNNAQGLANELFDLYHRLTGDATIIIAKYNL